MAEEMRYHLEQRAADQAAEGLSPEEARYAAERKFGNVASLQEQARTDRGWRWLENFVLDLRLGVRSLLKSPGFTCVAILTLGLGIGANTLMFTMMNGIVSKPLPYPGVEQLARLYRATAQNPNGHVAPADFLDFQRALGARDAVAAYTPASASLSEPGQPAEMAYAARSTANLFAVFGTSALSSAATSCPRKRRPARTALSSSAGGSGSTATSATRTLSAARSGSTASRTRSSG